MYVLLKKIWSGLYYARLSSAFFPWLLMHTSTCFFCPRLDKTKAMQLFFTGWEVAPDTSLKTDKILLPAFFPFPGAGSFKTISFWFTLV